MQSRKLPDHSSDRYSCRNGSWSHLSITADCETDALFSGMSKGSAHQVIAAVNRTATSGFILEGPTTMNVLIRCARAFDQCFDCLKISTVIYEFLLVYTRDCVRTSITANIGSCAPIMSSMWRVPVIMEIEFASERQSFIVLSYQALLRMELKIFVGCIINAICCVSCHPVIKCIITMIGGVTANLHPDLIVLVPIDTGESYSIVERVIDSIVI